MTLPSIRDYAPAAAEVLLKRAATEQRKPSRFGHVATIMAGSALGGAAGYGAGKLTGYALDAISEKATGSSIPAAYLAIPGSLLGAVLGAAYARHQEREQEALRRGHEDYLNQRTRRSP